MTLSQLLDGAGVDRKKCIHEKDIARVTGWDVCAVRVNLAEAGIFPDGARAYRSSELETYTKTIFGITQNTSPIRSSRGFATRYLYEDER